MSQSPDVPVEAPLAPSKYLFQMVHVLYAVVLLVSSLAILGPWGIALSLMVTSFWATVFFSKLPRTKALLITCGAVLVNIPIMCLAPGIHSDEEALLALVCFISFPLGWFYYHRCLNYFSASFVVLLLVGLLSMSATTGGSRQAARRYQCLNNMKMIGLALHNYYDEYESLPPPYIADENGTPMHSWRVLILPFLDQKALYKKYDFAEPWDGPNNIKLLDQMPYEYVCPSRIYHKDEHEFRTPYLAVVGPDCIWSARETRTFADIEDGLSNTVMLTEFGESETLWLQPSDMEYQAALNILGSNDPEVFKEIHANGRNVLMGDGSVRFILSGLVPEIWTAMLSINDPEPVDFESFELQRILERPDPWPFGYIVRPIIFIVLLFLPLPWVWIKPKVADTSDDPVDMEQL